MLYVKSRNLILVMLSCFLLACNEDLSPSSTDKRESIETGSTGHQAGQIASEFTIPDTEENLIILSDELRSYDAVVLYFTMWCPVCDSHMSTIREAVKPNYPNVHFINVDYVSGSLSQARANQVSNGYRSETVVADPSHTLTEQFKGDMGVTIVISTDSQIVMNEGFKYSKLIEALDLASQP